MLFDQALTNAHKYYVCRTIIT